MGRLLSRESLFTAIWDNTRSRSARSGGGTTQNPGWMIQRLANLGKAGKIGQIDQWSETFRNRTGQNVNVSVNAVGKVLTLLAQSN